MERRKLLLGTGGTLAATIAGCLGGDDDPNDPDEEGSTGDSGGGGGGGGGGKDDVPGVDDGALKDRDEVEDVTRDGETVSIDVTFDPDRIDEYEGRIEELADELADIVEDPAAFASEVARVDVTVMDTAGEKILAFYVNVQWIVNYLEGTLDLEDYHDKVKGTAD